MTDAETEGVVTAQGLLKNVRSRERHPLRTHNAETEGLGAVDQTIESLLALLASAVASTWIVLAGSDAEPTADAVARPHSDE